MPTKLTLQSVLDFARTNARLAPLQDVGGVPNEPGLSICNDVIEELLSAPYAWRFNRANAASQGIGVLPFTSANNQQDYQLTNATASVGPISGTTPPGGGIVHIQTVANNGVTLSGTTATVTTMWPHGFSAGQSVTMLNVGSWASDVFSTISQYNGTFTILATPTPTTFTFTTSSGLTTPAGAPGIADIGWVERCVLEDWASTATVKPRHEIEVNANLPLESIIQPPMKIAFQYSFADASAAGQTIGSTIAVFRYWPIPSSQIWTAYVDYQMRAPVYSALNVSWSPWPDELGYVLRAGVKAYALDFLEDPRAITEMNVFQQKMLKALDIKDQEQRHESFFPDRPVLFGG